MTDDMYFTYQLKCVHPGCGGQQMQQQCLSAGWTVGTPVPFDPSTPTHGRCPRCLRHTMQVATAPAPPTPSPPIGFTRVPTE